MIKSFRIVWTYLDVADLQIVLKESVLFLVKWLSVACDWVATFSVQHVKFLRVQFHILCLFKYYVISKLSWIAWTLWAYVNIHRQIWL